MAVKTVLNWKENKIPLLVWIGIIFVTHENRIYRMSYKTNTVTHLWILSCYLQCVSTKMKSALWSQDKIMKDDIIEHNSQDTEF